MKNGDLGLGRRLREKFLFLVEADQRNFMKRVVFGLHEFIIEPELDEAWRIEKCHNYFYK